MTSGVRKGWGTHLGRLTASTVIATLILVTGGAIGQAQSAAPAAGPAVDRVVQAGVIRIGYSNEFPFAFVNGDQLTGEAPEMMKRFAATLGVPVVDGVLIEWAGLIPALQAKRIDAIAAGMAITPERCKQVIFAEPEVIYGASLIVKAGNPKGITSWKSIAEQPDAKMGMISGTADLAILPINNVPEDRILQFPDFPSMLAAVQGGRIDAAWLDSLSAKDVVEKSGDPNLEIVTPSLEDYPVNAAGDPSLGWGAVVFRPEDADLRDALTSWVQGAKASGELWSIMEPFGFDESQVAPLGTSVDELCAAA